MIRNGRDLRRARLQLGMTMGELGEALRLSGDVNDRINKLEREREIPGPTAVAVEAMLAGFVPQPVERTGAPGSASGSCSWTRKTR